MALGNYRNNTNVEIEGNNNEPYRPETYGLSFTNAMSETNKLSIKISYWKTLMRLKFCPPLNTGVPNVIRFDYDNTLDIYLTPQKAMMLKIYMDQFIESLKADSTVDFNKAIQVNTGVIVLTNDGSFTNGDKIPVLAGLKINDSGNITNLFIYEFKVDEEFGIVGYNPESSDYNTETEYFKYIELEHFSINLSQFINASTMAIAATVMDRNSFEFSKIRSDVSKIADKLGVSLVGNRTYSAGATKNSFFNRNGNSNSTPYSSSANSKAEYIMNSTTTLDELEM